MQWRATGTKTEGPPFLNDQMHCGVRSWARAAMGGGSPLVTLYSSGAPPPHEGCFIEVPRSLVCRVLLVTFPPPPLWYLRSRFCSFSRFIEHRTCLKGPTVSMYFFPCTGKKLGASTAVIKITGLVDSIMIRYVINIGSWQEFLSVTRRF